VRTVGFVEIMKTFLDIASLACNFYLVIVLLKKWEVKTSPTHFRHCEPAEGRRGNPKNKITTVAKGNLVTLRGLRGLFKTKAQSEARGK